MLASLWPPSPVAVYQTVEGRVSRHHDNDQDKDRTTLILVMSHFIVQYLQKSETKNLIYKYMMMSCSSVKHTVTSSAHVVIFIFLNRKFP